MIQFSGTTAGASTNIQQRIPLPGPEMLEEEPLYVNAKQYHRLAFICFPLVVVDA